MSDSEQIAWLVGLRLQSFDRREFDWVVTFDGDASLVIECLWRLIEGDRIRFTSEDDGQQFGLPAPVNAAAEATRRLTGALVESVELREGTLDLCFCFGGGYVLQIIPVSSGYEAWQLSRPRTLIIATGGGGLSVFRDSSD